MQGQSDRVRTISQQALDRLHRYMALDQVPIDLGRMARGEVVADSASRPVRSTIGIIGDRHACPVVA
jgi:hypothetical protein